MESTADDDNGACQDIIPGLPNDLALRCLSKMSHGYHGLLEVVSKRWRDVIRSSDYACLRASEGWSGNWLFVLPAHHSNFQWVAYDPDADRWHPLPRIPDTVLGEDHFGFSCISVGKRFLLIGGDGPSATDSVIAYDPLKNQWSRAANMQTGRSNFACAFVCGKVYVAGGSCNTGGLAAAEVYDPNADRWEDLPPMPFALPFCFSISYGGEFHVVGRKSGSVHNTYVIFNPVDRLWRIVKDYLPFSKLTSYDTTLLNNKVYNIYGDGIIRVLDRDRQVWETLGVLPAVVLPDHSRTLQRFSFGFVGGQRHLYIVGGMALKYDSESRTYDIVKLSSVQFCDPSNLPLQWQDARDMPRPYGVSDRFFFMEE